MQRDAESSFATIEAIAKKYLRVETLRTRNIEDLDFHRLSVWWLRAALDAAYASGFAAATVGLSMSKKSQSHSTKKSTIQ
jgi:hypothetical protein